MSTILEQKEQVQSKLASWIKNDPRRLAILAELIVAIPLSRSVQSGDLAGNIIRDVQDRSIAQMLSRFYKNRAISWEEFYWPQVERIVKSLHVSAYHLLIDTTDVGEGHKAVVLSLAYHNRSLPLVWQVETGTKGHVSEEVQVKLLKKLYTYFHPEKPVIFQGDSEFDGVLVLRQLAQQGWYYVIRTSPSLYIHPQREGERIQLGDLVPTVDAPEKSHTQVYFTSKHRFGPLHCFACWQSPHKQPLILIYHLPPDWGYSPRTTYKIRSHTEPLFADFKEAGFRLTQSRLQHDERLSRLFLALSSAYLWMVSLGAWVLCRKDTAQVDQPHRRTLSIFKIGWRWFKRQLKLDFIVPFSLILPTHFDFPDLKFTNTCVG